MATIFFHDLSRRIMQETNVPVSFFCQAHARGSVANPFARRCATGGNLGGFKWTATLLFHDLRNRYESPGHLNAAVRGLRLNGRILAG
jgi:hypothetical protein